MSSGTDVAARPDGRGLLNLLDRLPELPDRRLLRYERGELVETTYPELWADVRSLVEEMRQAGVGPRMRVGILGENSYEWIVCELALIALDAVTITFPVEEFRKASAEELRQRFSLRALLLSKREAKRRGEEEGWIGVLATSGLGFSVCAEDQVERPEKEPPEDVFTMSFSSGTSGRLKCIMLSRRGTEDLICAYHEAFPFRHEDSILIVLPLSAFQQRLMIYAAIWHGFDMHLVDVAQLMRGLQEMQPTILAGPPAFYEMLENRFRGLPASRRRPLLAAGAALRVLPRPLRRAAARRLFAPFYRAYGGRMRLMLSGSAPSRMSTLRLFEMLQMPLVQAYGLTETGFISWNVPWRNRPGSVGQLVFPGTVRLEDDGEIVVRYRNQQSPGYFDVPAEEERKTFLADGWIATGDIGRFDDDGYLYISGRKKEILITRGGYKLQPEPIEQALCEVPAVEHAVVLGGEELPSLTAVVALPEEAGERDEEAVRTRLKEINSDLPSAARVARTHFTRTQFSIENGLLTRNLKVDRRAVMSTFGTELGAAIEGGDGD